MKTKRSINKALVSLFGMLSLCLICFTVAPIPVSYWTKPLDAPEYIESVWPPPDSQIWNAYYELSRYNGVAGLKQAGINVAFTPTIDIALMERVPENSGLVPVPLLERTFLYVDGMRISNDLRTTLDNIAGMLPSVGDDGWKYLMISSEYSISWRPPLSTGKHTAKFVVETASGEVFEYEWEFRIR